MPSFEESYSEMEDKSVTDKKIIILQNITLDKTSQPEKECTSVSDENAVTANESTIEWGTLDEIHFVPKKKISFLDVFL